MGKGSAIKTLILEGINAVSGTGRKGAAMDYNWANGNFMPDQPPRPDVDIDLPQESMPQQIPREAQGMPDASVQNLERSAVESFQWMRNKEGGQAYGNQQVTVPLTEQIFQQEMQPRMREGYAASLAEYQAKHPEVTHASFVKVAGEGPWKFNGDGTVDSLRPNPPNRGWAMPVDSFKSKAAKAQGKTADSEAFPAPRGQAMPDVGININDSTQPFTSQILSGEKTIETRDTDSLRPYVGRRIGLVRTGAGKAMLVGYADVGEPTVYTSSSQFRSDENLHRVAEGSAFDIKRGGKKFGYPLTNVQAIEPAPVTSSGIVARKIPQPVAATKAK
jgi:hypothetical protein